MNMRQLWRDISLSKKIYTVVGVMGVLIASELFTLLFAMNTLSSVRAFVGGEGTWSKAQKDAVLNLQRYTQTHDSKFYDRFLKCLEIPSGDRIARVELFKANPDFIKIENGFLQGGIHKRDIPGIVNLIINFHSFHYLSEAIALWSDADDLLDQLNLEAARLHRLMREKSRPREIARSLDNIDILNDHLTELETKFSSTLGEGSRHLEHLLMVFLFCAALTVESIGLLLIISFNRNLSRSLFELYNVAVEVSKGKFNQTIPVRSRDELGKLAGVINKMTADLRVNIGKRERAENANRVKSLFLANMSHEIRTPLSAIMGFTELLRGDDLLLTERKQYVEIIHRTSQSLTTVINDILDLSKVEAGHIEIENVKFSLKNLLLDLKSVLEIRCLKKEIKIKFEQLGDVPDIIFSDPYRIHQILMNLLGNAIKFTERGQVTLKCEVRNGKIHFLIEDTGIGLTDEQTEVLFQSFRQVDNSTTRKYEGTGLGLVLSKRLANLLEGNVVLLKSKINSGSTFDFYFKYQSIEQTEPVPSHVATPFQVRASGSGMNILLVEDVEDNRLLLQHVLGRQGYIVTTANNGEEGVTKAMNADFDLVLMDIQMPIMDGYAATQRLRQMGYKKPIIALTAHAMKEDRSHCIEVGCNDYLTKPLQITKLIDKITMHSSKASVETPLSI